jgi:hypothetical protein
MARRYQIQSNLNRGELDPRLVGRPDIDAYFNGLFEATNCQVIPQGGVKKRPGMSHINEVNTSGRMEEFAFSTTQTYLLVFTNLRMYIYKDKVLQQNINGSGNDFLVTTITEAQTAIMDFIQTADTVIITHEDFNPISITRSSDTSWTIANIVLTNISQFDFNDASSPTPLPEEQTITFTNRVSGDTYKISLNGIQTEEITFGELDTGAGGASNVASIQRALQDLPNTANSGVRVVQTSASVFRIIFENESAFPYDLMSATPVRTFLSNFNTNFARVTTGVDRSENTFSATRGWPRTCTFHEARLWFGGSKSRPNSIFSSRVNDFFNLDQGRGRDDEGLEFTLDTDQVNAINGVYSNGTFQIFTTGREFFIPQTLGEPITPESITVWPSTNSGSKRVRPVSVDKTTLFVRRRGKSINQFVFESESEGNSARSVSILAPQLINDPVQMYVQRGTDDDDANYVYIVNSDGNMAVFNTLIDEDVRAFTGWETSGNIKSVAVVDDIVYTLTERVINSVTVFQVDVENTSTDMDSNVTGNFTGNTITGLGHLEGETVEVKVDDAVQIDNIVSGGQITVVAESGSFEVGLSFRPLIQTMPLTSQTDRGPDYARQKKIIRVAVQTFLSNGVVVFSSSNGTRITLPDKTIGLDQFDAPVPQTELKRTFISGYDLQAQLTITQDTPVPWQIMSIFMELSV